MIEADVANFRLKPLILTGKLKRYTQIIKYIMSWMYDVSPHTYIQCHTYIHSDIASMSD